MTSTAAAQASAAPGIPSTGTSSRQSTRSTASAATELTMLVALRPAITSSVSTGPVAAARSIALVMATTTQRAPSVS
nr:hypothetical protein [Nocardioides solisilvae]